MYAVSINTGKIKKTEIDKNVQKVAQGLSVQSRLDKCFLVFL